MFLSHFAHDSHKSKQSNPKRNLFFGIKNIINFLLCPFVGYGSWSFDNKVINCIIFFQISFDIAPIR